MSIRLGFEVAAWGAGAWLLARVPRVGAGESTPRTAVTVVVPARDEERTLPDLLGSLAGQVPDHRVIVVDDSSTDGTAGVARAGGAEVVSAPPPPEGWTGKAWACWTGAQAASGGTLVFLDADTTLAPGALARILAEHGRRGGLLSVMPFHVTRRAYESLSGFFLVVAAMAIGAFRAWPRPRPSGAFGQCLVTATVDYAAVDGHRSVRGAVVEDAALARRYAASGLPVTCLGGRGAVEVRMYPDGVGDLADGWTKNFATGARGTPPVTLVLVAAWVAGCILAAAGPFLSGPPLVVAAAYLAYAGQLDALLARLGRLSWWGPAIFPVALAFFLVVFARSLLATYVRHEVRWRGRVVRV